MNRLVTPLVLIVALGSGCMHVTTKLPGVVDLRSDGSGAAPAKQPLQANPDTTRTGVGAFFSGDGLQSNGADITIEDRQWWLFGLVQIVNDGGEAEYAALPKGTVLRNVKIGDKFSGMDWVLYVPGSWLASAVTFFVGGLGGSVVAALPHMTLTMSGQRIESGAAAAEPPPPTDTPPPAADPTAIPPAPPAAPPAPAPAPKG